MDQCTDTPESITWTNVQILPNQLHGPMHRYSQKNYMDQCTDTPESITWTNAQILLNILHGPMHYKIGVTCVYNGHVFCTLL